MGPKNKILKKKSVLPFSVHQLMKYVPFHRYLVAISPEMTKFIFTHGPVTFIKSRQQKYFGLLWFFFFYHKYFNPLTPEVSRKKKTHFRHFLASSELYRIKVIAFKHELNTPCHKHRVLCLFSPGTRTNQKLKKWSTTFLPFLLFFHYFYFFIFFLFSWSFNRACFQFKNFQESRERKILVIACVAIRSGGGEVKRLSAEKKQVLPSLPLARFVRSFLLRAHSTPSPSPSDTCHAGYTEEYT